MTLSISGTYIRQVSQLGVETRITLSIIDGGLPWLDWAMSDQLVRYALSDETELVKTVQQGLHSSPLCFLPNLGLLISPIKLMTLGSSLPVLTKAESENQSIEKDQELQQILKENDLFTHQNICDGLNLLKQLEVDKAAIFSALNFEDRLMLYRLSRSLESSEANLELQREAAAFSLEQAFSCHEFCDYLLVYLLLSLHKENSSQQERLSSARHCLEALLPLLFGSLESIQVQGIPGPAEISPLIQRWLAMGKRLGFPNISSGLLTILNHSIYEQQPISYWNNTISAYLATAQSMIAASTPIYAWIHQSGNGCTIGYKNDTQTAELVVNNGLISLQSFRTLSD